MSTVHICVPETAVRPLDAQCT